MTTYYVSSAGSNTSPYDTWAKAATAIANAEALVAAGDVILVDGGHSETGLSVVFGTAVSAAKTDPYFVISVDKDNSETLEAGATFSGSSIDVGTTGDTGVVTHGITIEGSNGAAGDVEMQADSAFEFNETTFQMGANADSSREWISTGDLLKRFWNCEFNSTTNTGPKVWLIDVLNDQVMGGGYASGTAAMTAFLERGEYNSSMKFDGLDLSGGATALEFVDNLPNAVQGPQEIILSNSKVPSGFQWPSASSVAETGSRFEALNLLVGTTKQRMWFVAYGGEITDDTSVYLDAEDRDGTSFSLEYACNANLAEGCPLGTMIWEGDLGANPTIQINFTSNATLDQFTAFLVIQYPDATDDELAQQLSTRDWQGFVDAATGGGSVAALSTNTPGWTGALTNQYQISQSLTSSAGTVRIWFYVAKDHGSAFEVNVDPEPDIT